MAIKFFSGWRFVAMTHLLFLLPAFHGHAQTKNVATDTTESKLKFIDKIGHWFTAYAMTSPDFLENDKNAFKSSA
jgi:hypothetical protein